MSLIIIDQLVTIASDEKDPIEATQWWDSFSTDAEVLGGRIFAVSLVQLRAANEHLR